MAKLTVDVALNRVEGDLEIRAEVEDGVVVDARSVGTMYRGFENILRGRAALDALVIAPRICGACSSAHLLVAAEALDRVAGLEVTPSGQRVRNVALMAENMQNDLRQAFLMFCVDFTDRVYSKLPSYDEAVRRYRPFEGSAVAETVRTTKQLLEIVALLGGQWPHSSFMIPGGVVSLPSPVDLARCRQLLAGFRRFYERHILGCSIEQMLEVRDQRGLEAWLELEPHRQSEVGFFCRFAIAAGLDRMGRGHGRFISFGGLTIPEESSVGPAAAQLVPAGFATHSEVSPFDESRVEEHVAHSWFADYAGGRHPFDGETKPYATGDESQKYSWAKAPRYDGWPAETGALAEAMVARDPLFVDLTRDRGPSAFARQLARLLRPARLVSAMDIWLDELSRPGAPCQRSIELESGRGFGLIEAARGALGHWVEVSNGKISKYQIVTPTAWNGSPRDARGVRGPWEEALIGASVPDPENPTAIGHIIRSFDPCQVCTVHAVERGQPRTKRPGP